MRRVESEGVESEGVEKGKKGERVGVGGREGGREQGREGEREVVSVLSHF